MGGGVDQRALVVLAVDLHQRRADRLERLHADRLVVDEGAGAAVGKLDAAQDQFAGFVDLTVVEAIGLEDRECRMGLGDIEAGGDLAVLGAVADQRGIAAAAERQREGIEQNRFAGAGLAGQHRKATGKLDVEPLDQHDIADRQAGKHAR